MNCPRKACRKCLPGIAEVADAVHCFQNWIQRPLNNRGCIDWLSRFFDKIKIGFLLNRFIPICDITGTLPSGLTKEERREWVKLDTFDMFSPAYDQPQRISDIVDLFNKYGMKDVWGGYIKYENCKAAVVKGTRK